MANVLAAFLLAAVLVPEPSRSDSFLIESKILGETRRVVVHLPASFAASAASRRYPTVVVFDGEYLLRPVVTTSDVLTRQGQMPESILVAIENTDDYAGRVRDLTPPGLSVSGSGKNERGDLFLDFIEKELLPALDQQFRAGPPRTLVGTSSGGILVTYAAATREAFRFTLALDAPTHLGDGFLGKKLLARARARPATPLRYVSLSARFGWSEDEWKRITAAAPPTWMLHSEKLAHESHTSMQFAGAYIGLRELFHDYSMIAAPQWPTTSVVPYYDKLAAYGMAMVPPQPLLERVIDDLLMEGRNAAARNVFDTLTAAYGAPREAAQLDKRIAEVERLPPPTETVEGLLATPFPSPEELRDYLGEWEGQWWINPEDKQRQVLRLYVEDGKVAGELIGWPMPNERHVQKLEYIKITADGLTFGQMNGMRPRGVLLHEAKRDGDVLSGAVRFGGINFVPPDGHVMPDHRFVLRKKR